MNTDLRNWYLSALGITHYIPKASEPVVGEEPLLSAEKPAAEQVFKPQAERLINKLNFSESPPAARKVAEQSAAEQPESDEDKIAFRLACWQPVDDLLVIDSLEPGQQPGAGQMQLLANILRAIKRLPLAGMPAAELIDWPTSRGGPGDEAGARALLSVFLDARIKKHGVCWVLLMGESAAAYIGAQTGQFEEEHRRELSGGATAILCHSLSTMLKDAATKAETWRAIQFLAGD